MSRSLLLMPELERRFLEALQADDVEALVMLRFAAVLDADDPGRPVLLSIPRNPTEDELERLDLDARITLAQALRRVAEAVDPPDAPGVLHACPRCAERQRIPQEELDDPRLGGRYCIGRGSRRHDPVIVTRIAEPRRR